MLYRVRGMLDSVSHAVLCKSLTPNPEHDCDVLGETPVVAGSDIPLLLSLTEVPLLL